MGAWSSLANVIALLEVPTASNSPSSSASSANKQELSCALAFTSMDHWHVHAEVPYQASRALQDCSMNYLT